MTVRFGLIGCGDVAWKRVARALRQATGSQLVAACRRDVEKLKAFCDEFDVPRRYTSDAELLADGEVDAVYIATPVYLHRRQTQAAAKAGKHVLVEKPMAMTVDDCTDMIDACARHDVRLGVAYYRRFYPAVRRIEELLAAGDLGAPMAATVVTACAPPIFPEEEGSWRVRLEDGGGGALMDIGSHRINLLLHLFGEVAEVVAVCGNIASRYEAEDAASLLIAFSSGVQASLQCLFGPADDPDYFSIVGTEGRVTCVPLNGGELVVERGGERRLESLPPHENFCLPLVKDFIAAIKEGRDPLVGGDEGRLTNLIMETAYQDARA
ncbi:MAG: Gfo/Idh/MocA family oxidoreductase [Pirellulaceae bacterium]